MIFVDYLKLCPEQFWFINLCIRFKYNHITRKHNQNNNVNRGNFGGYARYKIILCLHFANRR